MLRAHRRTGGAAALAVAALVLAGCTGGPAPTPSATPPPPSGDGVLRIGTLFSTAGEGAASTAGAIAAVNAAVREIDAAGGYGGTPVEVLTRNGGAAGDGAAEASFAELVELGVDVVIGPSTVELAAVLAPLAEQAGIPLISPIATGARPDGTEGALFRTVPAATAQAAQLAETLGVPRVALLRADDPAGQTRASALAAALAERESELVADVVAGADPAADAQQILSASPDAVVVATGGTGDETSASLAALGAAGVPASSIWITGASFGRYDDAAGPLEGAHGFQTGVAPGPEFVTRVRQEDPGARVLLYSPNAYDATVLAALAAVLTGDDGGASITHGLRSAAAGGIPCRSFGECLHVLGTQSDIAYEGASGPLAFDDAGDRAAAVYVQYLYDAAGAAAVTGNAVG